MQQHLTVMFSTLNRSEALRVTLGAMGRVRRPPGWSVEFVVVDNGSSDATAEVLKKAKASLPLQSFWCAEPGKSNALNLGLEKARLGELVVFTDDDVTPDVDWLEAIIAVSARWPKHSVFGGRIDPTWPNGKAPPEWAQAEFIQSFAFTRHVIDSVEREYPDHFTPFGPNYWVRAEALQGMRFMSGLGPRPKHRKLGQETEFLRRLRAKGFVAVYSPAVRVEHRVESTRLSKWAVYRRAFQLGRGSIYTHWLPEEPELARSIARWLLRRARSLAKSIFQLPLSAVRLDESQRVLGIVNALVTTGVEVEALRTQLSRETKVSLRPVTG